MSPLRLAVIGFGGIAQSKYTPALLKLTDQFDVRVVVNPSPEPLELAGRRFPEAVLLADLPDDLADLGPLDAALVLTPPFGRPHLVRRLLEANLHVLAEKPLAVTAAAAAELADVAAEHHRLLLVAHTRRSDATFPVLAQHLTGHTVLSAASTTLETPWQPIVELAPLAKPVDQTLEFNRPLPTPEAHEIATALGTADDRALRYYRWVVIESLIHDLDLLATVLGPATSVEACTYADSAIALTGLITFGSTTATVRWVVAHRLSEYQQTFDFICADSRCVLEYPSPFLLNAPARLTVHTAGVNRSGHRAATHVGSYQDGFLRLLAMFAERIRRADVEPDSVRAAVHALRISEALARCQFHGLPITIDEEARV